MTSQSGETDVMCVRQEQSARGGAGEWKRNSDNCSGCSSTNKSVMNSNHNTPPNLSQRGQMKASRTVKTSNSTEHLWGNDRLRWTLSKIAYSMCHG